MHYTLMQISDLHAGPPFRPDIAAIVAQQAHELKPDLLVISGDFVQRAVFPDQWRTIVDFMHTLPQPRLVVPGNHDVPLLDGLSRVAAPLSYYRRHITTEMNPVFHRPGLAVVGGCSAHGLTMDGGYVTRRQRAALDRAFSEFGPETFKVAVMHHPIVSPPGRKLRGKISNASSVIRLLERLGVELYLCGHIHFSYIDAVAYTSSTAYEVSTGQRAIVIGQSGTTTSGRGRGTDRGKNSFNVITIDDQTIRIQPHFYMPEQQRFLPIPERVFHRHHTVHS
jgi:3',5'-cyclic AMP phosphodiesterase CpdA